MGKTISEWDDLDEHDRAHVLGVQIAELRESEGRCKACGGPASECQDVRNQHAYEVEFRRCYRTAAALEAQRKRTDMDGVQVVVTYNPAKRKPPKPEQPRDEQGRFIKRD